MKIIEINKNNVYLCIYRGFLQIKKGTEELGREPLADIDSIIVSGFSIRYSHNMLAKLCELNIPLIICGDNFMPVGYLLSYCANYEHTGRLIFQIECSLPLKKRLWQSIIKKKITNQKLVLNELGDEAKDFSRMVGKVRSGDPDNLEAQAAVRYWKRAIGIQFCRDFKLPGINSFLNFGYAIIRSCTARYIVACGLIPSIGLHHHNKLNPFCLADDIMEPFRPYVDRKIIEMKVNGSMELTPANKKELANLLNERFVMVQERLTLDNCIKQTVLSLLNSFKYKINMIKFPEFYDKRS